MNLITVKSTNYGIRVETASRSLPTEKQLKKVDKFIKHTKLYN